MVPMSGQGRCPYGPVWYPCQGKGGGRKRKNHVLESVFFVVVCPYGPVWYPCQGKGGGRKRKNHVLESVFFSLFAHTGLYSTHVRATEEVENEKTYSTF